MPTGQDRSGLPLNINAAPFVPCSPPVAPAMPDKGNGTHSAWQAQADTLGNHGKQAQAQQSAAAPSTYEHNPYIGYASASEQMQAASSAGRRTPATPPSAAPKAAYQAPRANGGAVPPHPGQKPAAPRSNGSTPNLHPRTPGSGALHPHSGKGGGSSRCPAGHVLARTAGSQMVNRDQGLVFCGGVFCRRCDQESLEKKGPYFTCTICNWDCCLDCEAAPYAGGAAGGGIPAMPPLPHAMSGEAPIYPDELLSVIRSQLAVLGDEEPFGLVSMPFDKLVIYEQHLREKLQAGGLSVGGGGGAGGQAGPGHQQQQHAQQHHGHGHGHGQGSYGMVVDVAPKVNVTKSRTLKKREKPMLSYKVGDMVQFKAGGRFTGNKKWKDGATLTLNEVGSIMEIDIKEKWPYKVQFDHVYVMLMEADIAAAPEPPKQAAKAAKPDSAAPKPATPATTTPAASAKADAPASASQAQPAKEASTAPAAAAAPTSAAAGLTTAAVAAADKKASAAAPSAAAAAPTQTSASTAAAAKQKARTDSVVAQREGMSGTDVAVLLATGTLAAAALFWLRRRKH